jgi:hypothetical protein
MLLAFAGLVALVVGLLLLLNRDPEPAYNGKRLGEWISIYLAAESLTAVKEAGAAIQMIGTNALPILIDWIDYHHGPLRRHALTHWDKLPGGLRNHSVFHRWLFGGYQRSGHAQSAFAVLRDQAVPAIPALHQLVRDSASPETRRGAVMALAAIGPGAMTAMTNILATAFYDEQRLVLNSLTKLGTNAAPAVPALIHQVHHGDMRTAELSAETLGTLRLVPDETVPALIDGLADSNSRMRAAAAKALGSFGAQAIIALPVLNQLETDPDQGVSRAARAAITAITGVAPSGPAPLPIGSR